MYWNRVDNRNGPRMLLTLFEAGLRKQSLNPITNLMSVIRLVHVIFRTGIQKKNAK